MSEYSKLAREVELSGLRKLKDFYGIQATVLDLASTSSYDFRILHSDGSVGIGEFSWLEDKVKFSAWMALAKQEQHHIIPLNPGSGQWALSVKHEARINHLYRQLPALIEKMILLEIDGMEIDDVWPIDDISRECGALGIIYIYATGYIEPDQAFYLLEASGGIIPTDLTLLARHLEELINGQFRDCWVKLLGTPAQEKHVYLRMGSFIPFNLSDTLRVDRDPAEISDIAFPEGITHIWLEGGSENLRNVLWRRDDINIYF